MGDEFDVSEFLQNEQLGDENFDFMLGTGEEAAGDMLEVQSTFNSKTDGDMFAKLIEMNVSPAAKTKLETSPVGEFKGDSHKDELVMIGQKVEMSVSLIESSEQDILAKNLNGTRTSNVSGNKGNFLSDDDAPLKRQLSESTMKPAKRPKVEEDVMPTSDTRAGDVSTSLLTSASGSPKDASTRQDANVLKDTAEVEDSDVLKEDIETPQPRPMLRLQVDERVTSAVVAAELDRPVEYPSREQMQATLSCFYDGLLHEELTKNKWQQQTRRHQIRLGNELVF
eukprot:CAMPEP_0184740030 /NCGR_PEP_ID=MMETSP0315-20130426/3000_1 /TAXON_ID=101924 /ORGANISM="Rhodosorus marinus, Strain UTEX LB 2760" /LENGTH=281 /DNA_ID=CAMNT_0027209389 /DNA_START=13 /DNA_END=858 /DNA_ORIENTATION=-